MRIATYNVEWFEDLFDKDSNLQMDQGWSRRYDVRRVDQATAIAEVIRQVDADLILIVEAPNTGQTQDTVKALEGFAQHFGLRQSAVTMGFANETHQELAVMYDPYVVRVTHDPQGAISDGSSDAVAPRFDGKFRYDVEVDGQAGIFEFSKPPVELSVEYLAKKRNLRIIGVHTKSKSTYGAKDAADELRMVVENRRKQLAQCIWIRQRAEAHLVAGEPLVVLGDFNDGPGVNDFETLFAKSGVEIVLGDAGTMEMVEPHAAIMLDPRQSWSLATSRFYISKYKRYLNALLDYVMLSPDLAQTAAPAWRIWHPFDDPECFKDDNLRDALLTASDHFPVSVDLTF
ncbi:MAG: endonuclease/exonuclease/phosphatase family protein [Paracoccaceae bacterium]|jgi:endonuclease/exonuclease/phosphatase family metal-dependent hydrolase